MFEFSNDIILPPSLVVTFHTGNLILFCFPSFSLTIDKLNHTVVQQVCDFFLQPCVKLVRSINATCSQWQLRSSGIPMEEKTTYWSCVACP